MSWEKVLEVMNNPSNVIKHVVRNEDASYSVVFHIVCEFCDFCDEENKRKDSSPLVHNFKENIYEVVGR